MVNVNSNQLSVRLIADSDSDPEETFVLGGRLRAELAELDVDAVEPVAADEVPEEAKGLADVAGWLTVTLGAAQQLATIIALVISWTERNRHTVEVSIDGDPITLSAATPEQQHQIVAAWLARHAPSA